MFITAIKKDKMHLTRLFLSNGDEFLIDNDVCAERGIDTNMELDLETLDRLKHESDCKRAKSRALWYLDRMDYTEKALFEKLIRAGFEKKACDEVLAKLVEIGLVDDERFAERFAQRCAESNISQREAVHKMLQKGVPYDLARQKIQELDKDEESQIAELLEKKYAYRLTQENGMQKVYAALIRKGFSFAAVRAALKKYSEELEFCEE